jgi:hypothetical protein
VRWEEGGRKVLMLPLSNRSHSRYPIHKVVSYQYQGKSLLTFTLDLSMGGMKIKTQSALPRDEYLRFKLVLGANSFWLRGRIAYSRFTPDQQIVSGVHFVGLSRDKRQSLQNYLATLEEHGHSLPLCAAGWGSSSTRNQN